MSGFNQPQPPQEISAKLLVPQWNVVMQGLWKLPAEQSVAVIQALAPQLEQAQQAQQRLQQGSNVTPMQGSGSG